MAARKKKATRDYRLDIREVLAQLDRRSMGYYERLGEAEQKAFEPFVVMRFLSACGDDEDLDLAHYQISSVNTVVNRHYSVVSRHPELQWKLLASCGLGVKRYHPWIPPGKRSRRTNRLDDLLRRFAPMASPTEIAVLKRVNSPDDLVSLAEDYALPEGEIREIRKELGLT